MFRYLIASAFLAAMATALPTFSDCTSFNKKILLKFSDTEKSTTATYEVCEKENIIHMEIAENDAFEHSEGLEDFNSGFAVEASDDMCLVYKLGFSNIKDRVKSLKSEGDHTTKGRANLDIYELEEGDYELIGENIVNFCEGKNIYKLGQDSFTELENFEDSDASARFIALFFGPAPLYRCFYYLCRQYCIITQLVLPTGSTASFTFIIG